MDKDFEVDTDPKQILVVEDDRGDFLLLKTLLKEDSRSRFHLTHAESVQQAREELDRSEFDIVLLDLSLSDSQGVDTIERMRDKKPKIPIVVLTGRDDTEMGRLALRKGVQDYLVKQHINFQMLYKSVMYAIERRRLEGFREDIVSNISHELRTPMTVIRESMMQIHDGLHGDVTERQKEYLLKGANNIDRLRRIIDNLLDISRIEEGKVEVYKRRTDLNRLLDQVYTEFQPYARKKGLELRWAEPAGRVYGLVDEEKIIQVLTNLIGNALKFTEQGFIELILEENETEVILGVRDSGIGIAAKDVPKLFQKFEQIGRKHGPGEKGTGLGLTIAKSLVELHGGKITFTTEQGKGSFFQCSLPEARCAFDFTDLIPRLEAAINEYQRFLLLRFSRESGPETGSVTPDMDFGKWFEIASAAVNRKNDCVVREKDGVYVILPDIDASNGRHLLKLIQEKIQEGAREPENSEGVLRSGMAAYPDAGLTADEILSKLMTHRGKTHEKGFGC